MNDTDIPTSSECWSLLLQVYADSHEKAHFKFIWIPYCIKWQFLVPNTQWDDQGNVPTCVREIWWWLLLHRWTPYRRWSPLCAATAGSPIFWMKQYLKSRWILIAFFLERAPQVKRLVRCIWRKPGWPSFSAWLGFTGMNLRQSKETRYSHSPWNPTKRAQG